MLRKESHYQLKTYTIVDSNEYRKPIWHIHGDIRNSNSIVLSHNSYGTYMSNVAKYYFDNQDRYCVEQEKRINSWVDYFIYGDIYSVGYSFDYNEYDIWWLLSQRRKIKKNKGEIRVYLPNEVLSEYRNDLDNIKSILVNTAYLLSQSQETSMIKNIKLSFTDGEIYSLINTLKSYRVLQREIFD